MSPPIVGLIGFCLLMVLFIIEVPKLYTVQIAPRWLMGYPEWPQSGLVGSLFVLCVGIMLVVLFR